MDLSFIICKCGQKKIFNFHYCLQIGTKMVVRVFCSVALVKFNTVGIISLNLLI